MNNQFIIILSGPPAAGKNVISKNFCQNYPFKIVEIDLDIIKSFVHNSPRTDFFLDLASEIGQSMVKIYLENQLSIIIHNAFCSYKFVSPFISIAEDMKIAYEYFKLTAPLDELLVRNSRRVCPSDEDNLKRIYNFNQMELHKQGITIDTMTYSIEESAKMIVDSINKKSINC